jgi:AraC-like DNA-binding protein
MQSVSALSQHESLFHELDLSNNSIYCHSGPCGETSVPLHKHNRGQLLYTEGGRVYVTAQDKIWYLPARHFMWIPAGMEHSLKVSMPSVLIWTIYFPEWKNESGFFKKIGIYPVNNMLLEQIYFTKNWTGHITEENKSRFYFASGIKAVLPEINESPLPFDLPLPADERLIKVVEYMQNNLTQHLTITDMAKKSGMSESSLSRLFKKDLKMSFISYLGTLRILRSIELLAIGKLNIKEICYEVGYESVPTFSNIFKKSVGVRPTTYLKVS